MLEKVSEQNILQKNLARFLIKDVFNTIDENDILTVVKGEKGNDTWYYKGKPLSPQQVKSLRLQAESYLKSDLWIMMRDEIIFLAQKNTLDKGTTEADLTSGKLLKYFIEVFENRMKRMLK
jgi:hypothetical protein